MRYVHIDIESRSSIDLLKQGLMRYVHHPSTRLLCVVFRVNGIMYVNELEALVELSEAEDTIWVAHNASFEYLMLHALVPGFHVPIHRWRCSAAVAAHRSLPRSLGACAYALGLDQQKDDEGKKVMMKMCKPLPVRQRKNNEVDAVVATGLHSLFGMSYTSDHFHLTAESFDTLIEYCRDDVLTEEAITDRLGFLPESEQLLWEKDFEINWVNGVDVDVELCEAAVKAFEETKQETNDACEELYGFTLTQTAKLAEFLGSEKVDKPTLLTMLEDPELPDNKREVIEWRQLVGNTSPAKFGKILDTNYKGKLYGLLMYHGANTGRWSGKGVQIQNLPRGGLDENWIDEEIELCASYIKNGQIERLVEEGICVDVADALKSTLRGAFTGDLQVSDYSQIEARMLPWLAGQDDVVESFRDGLDIYKVSASQIYRKPYEVISKQERFIGKIATLALGYQGGKGAFLAFAEAFGVKDIDEDTAEKIKKDWRRANMAICDYWYAVEDAAISAISSGSGYAPNVHFTYEDEFLRMHLPSGRMLYYYKPEIHQSSFDRPAVTFISSIGPSDYPISGTVTSAFGTRIGRVFTSPGRLVENLVQAASRDVLAESMMRIPTRHIRFHVHDELVCTDYNISDLEWCMKQVPTWAEGLPVDVDSWEGQRYRK